MHSPNTFDILAQCVHLLYVVLFVLYCSMALCMLQTTRTKATLDLANIAQSDYSESMPNHLTRFVQDLACCRTKRVP